MSLRTNALLAAAAVAGMASSAHALVWTSPNIPDEKTIALFRFDEGEGTVAANNAGTAYPAINLNSQASWTSDSGWLAGAASGGSLASTGTDYAALTAGEGAIDWSLPGVTISLWMKANGNILQDNYLLNIGYNGFRDLQAFIGYRSDWKNHYLMMDGVGLTDNRANNSWVPTAIDGEWHHMALVYDNANDTASLYFDNVKQLEWDVSTGYDAVVAEYMQIAKLHGQIDELLIQGEAMTDFSDGLNAVVPEPASLVVLGLSSVVLTRRRRAA